MAALLVVLVAVPAIGMVITSPTAGAWVFAGFFAVAWLLLLCCSSGTPGSAYHRTPCKRQCKPHSK